MSHSITVDVLPLYLKYNFITKKIRFLGLVILTAFSSMHQWFLFIRSLWLFLHFSHGSSSALWLCLSWVCCNSLLFSPLFATGVPLLHISFRFDSAGKLGRFTQLSGVQERMWTVSLEQWLRLGVGRAFVIFFSWPLTNRGLSGKSFKTKLLLDQLKSLRGKVIFPQILFLFT